MTERRGRPRSFDRDAALRCAVEVFWGRGYTATSVSDLTEAMGITPPSLYTAFGSKRALFLEAVDRYQETEGAAVTAPLTEGGGARATVAAVLSAAADAYGDPAHPPGCLVITAAANCGPDEADVQEDLRRRRAETTAALARCIAAGQEAGDVSAAADPRSVAVYYSAVIQGMSQQACDGASRAELHAVADTAMAAWPSG
ncbi:TetR/AcrR family transcriptional regulator [Streptomonospora salina]|uniref:AcrR family transcriptional regulator n=1 Tax=Streptomonospora salina TaxID=104205 RepID=A0A841E3I4_9ACTN|nr:TetR/AcrR family transcriptional regulator [Streptomonospora salina]MBB5997596.1 AcrR family transcriptional regulator [Streptomonospora salina]